MFAEILRKNMKEMRNILLNLEEISRTTQNMDDKYLIIKKERKLNFNEKSRSSFQPTKS